MRLWSSSTKKVTCSPSDAASQVKSLSGDVERTLSAAGNATAASILAGAERLIPADAYGLLAAFQCTGALIQNVFTITKSEILTSLNKPDHFVLALVRVAADDSTDVRYLRKPFKGTEEIYFDITSANYDWDEMFARALEPL